MKKQDLFKFSLTAVCLAVLSACGSSGGGKPTITTTPTTSSTAAQDAAAKAAAEKAAAEKAAAEAKAAAEKAAQDAAAKAAADKAAKDLAAAQKAAADAQKAAADAQAAAAAAAKKAADDLAAAKAAAQKAQDEAVKKAAEEAAKKALADKEVADKAAAEKAAAEAAAKKAAEEAAQAAKAADKTPNPFGNKDQLTAEPYTTGNESFVGIKQTVKVNSNLATNTSEAKDSTSDVPTPMTVQNPHPSLDTIVVAEPRNDAKAARVYLEDFDTRFLSKRPTGVNIDGAAATANQGNRELANIYKTELTNGMPKDFNAETEAKRKELISASKNATTAAEQAQQAYNAIVQEMKDIKDKVDAVDRAMDAALAEYKKTNPTATQLPPSETAGYKLQLDTLYAKQSALNGKEAEAKQTLHSATSAKDKAAATLRLFEDENGTTPTAQQTTRTKLLGSEYVETKTNTIGTQTGGVWIFGLEDVHIKHQNFTEYGKDAAQNPNTVKNGYVYQGKDINGNILVKGYSVKPVTFAGTAPTEQEKINGRTLDKTVAEVYGYRSQARNNNGDGFESPLDVMDYSSTPNSLKQDKSGNPYPLPYNNLPLVNDYYGARLHNVQYGRVTSALNGYAATEDYLKKGVDMGGNVPTYVASFGEYGTKGTENHYFYRGINNVGSEELKALKKDTQNGIITYAGHAVAYGLNNNYRGDVAIPTAIGAKAGFVSGNHAALTVNLANGEVIGNIHNKWYDSVNSPTALLPVKLVEFKGVIADNGNIAGTATRVDNQSTGVFGATLFGKGQEVGGSFASENHKDGKWGGVFGGIRQADPVKAAKEAGMSVGTDGKN
ncbi:hypothetical protein [Alysiella filiformis]|uniref:Transferrin-binding protein B C-lobe/N-lobe beta barrel domain-containing protein n=1 Tax=Alysiella filiformis DSM 16848 TaxID=1120981 RepID=A0A286EX08_9NEIS|nr:hypothetical protein [Alysiella filiformis]QMT31997.1 hypothetical protein H3L97_03735 [Alysiella filiformis]UBQ57095.1 hypothetical protein JF568_04940 [Alysiella filiformis DSM 16848]SOD75309.1 hypothetical protein SAMN02746062_02347 [Alysiella filiformis DSM 16848]